MALTLGLDTGGTYTDAVLLDERRVVRASAKALTTHEDLARGIDEALERVLAEADGPIGMVSLSTTLATNALVEGQGSPIALLLVGQEPAVLDRSGLRSAMAGDPVEFIDGGHDGSGVERKPLDMEAARTAIERHAPRVSAFAVSSHFAVRNPAHERRLQRLIGELCERPVSCGHQLTAALDAPRRALTAALNARLIPLLADLIGAVQGLLSRHDITAPLMVVRGDGSLMSADFAIAAPVETILSGPAASLVGARHLSGERDGVVFDMGGTTSDIAMLAEGEPRRNEDGAIVGGWRTRVAAVEVHTFGLGGDSAVRVLPARPFSLGPRREVPLSLLGSRHPHAVAILQEQAVEMPLREHAGRFAMRRRQPPGGPAGLSSAQRALWEQLADGPVSLVELFEGQTRQRALDRLVEQGLVSLAGFTPSDAAHVLGRHSAWSVPAAQAGAAIGARLARERFGRDLGDAEGFSARVIDAATEQGARFTLSAALAGTPAAPDTELAAGAAPLVDASVGAVPGPELVEVALHLKRPLIGIGAPAATYGPEIARKLGTRLALPAHAEVANAVGAVVAGVLQRVVARITPLPDERYRVHAPSGVSTFRTLEEAADWALAEAARLAEEQALAAGAVDVEVETLRDDVVGHTDQGMQLFFEATITATARGNPRVREDCGTANERE